MVELTTQVPRVRDLTVPARRLPVETDGVGTYELILAMWNAFDSDSETDSSDLGGEWITSVREATPDDLAAEIRVLGGPHCGLWLGTLGLVAAAPHPHDPDRVLRWLAEINPQRLQRWLLGYAGHHADPALIEQGVEGDLDAVRRVVAEGTAEGKDQSLIEEVVALFEIPGEELRDRMVGTIIRFREEVYSAYETGYSAAIERAAAAQRATSTRDDAKAIIEDVTNGLDYEIPPGISRVVLVPSVVLKPLSLIDQHRDTLLVFYGMADEFIDSDPEAPPSWLVNTYKALSDERRLRILRKLSEDETTLDELTELLGLSKSTVHHHMSILRAAGLVRVRIKDDRKDTKTYALRPQGLDNARAFLGTYIKSELDPASSQ